MNNTKSALAAIIIAALATTINAQNSTFNGCIELARGKCVQCLERYVRADGHKDVNLSDQRMIHVFSTPSIKSKKNRPALGARPATLKDSLSTTVPWTKVVLRGKLKVASSRPSSSAHRKRLMPALPAPITPTLFSTRPPTSLLARRSPTQPPTVSGDPLLRVVGRQSVSDATTVTPSISSPGSVSRLWELGAGSKTTESVKLATHSRATPSTLTPPASRLPL